jgi:hypothetical protein
MELASLLQSLQNYPSLGSLGLTRLTAFLELCKIAKPAIEASIMDHRTAPETLSLNILTILAGVLQEYLSVIKDCWKPFRREVWASSGGATPSQTTIDLYNIHALDRGTCVYLCPPFSSCD